MVSDLIEGLLTTRFGAAQTPPGLYEATVNLAVAELERPEVEQLIQQQFDQVQGGRGSVTPDAYFVYESAAEDALQRAAAGLRSALAQGGRILDPVPFERHGRFKIVDVG
jgi:hypothetical protein